MTENRPAEVLRQFFDRLLSGDLDGSIELVDNDCRWVTLPTLVWSRGEYHGPDGVRRYLVSLTEALSGGAVVPERFLECGDEVVVLGTAAGCASTTGIDVSSPFAFVFAVRSGLITSLHGFVDTATIRDAFEGRSSSAAT